jgi:hypothetical protein
MFPNCEKENTKIHVPTKKMTKIEQIFVGIGEHFMRGLIS